MISVFYRVRGFFTKYDYMTIQALPNAFGNGIEALVLEPHSLGIETMFLKE